MDGLNYKTFSSDATNYVLRSVRGSGYGNNHCILVVNNAVSGNPCRFKLFLYDTVSPNPTHQIINTEIPHSTNLYLDNEKMLSYNAQRYELRLTTTVAGGTTNIDITIK
tara:strand:- start:579 stop:905 length:327 start_codon:yes stop_codon:yes gene_type:complete